MGHVCISFSHHAAATHETEKRSCRSQNAPDPKRREGGRGAEERDRERHRRKRGRWEVGKTDKEKERDDVEDDADLLPLDQPVPPISKMIMSGSLFFHLKWLLLSQICLCLSACFRMNKRLRQKRRVFLTELVRTSLPASLYSKAALTYGEERGSFLHLHLCCCLPGWSFQTGVVVPLEAGCQDLRSTSCHVVTVLVVVLSV